MKCCDMKGFLTYLILWILSRKSMTGAEIAKELDKPIIKPVSIDTSKKPIKPKSKRYAQRRPFLVKKLGKKQKLPFIDLKVLRFCDGTNAVEDICKKSELPLMKVNEVLRKYQKKKLLRKINAEEPVKEVFKQIKSYL